MARDIIKVFNAQRIEIDIPPAEGGRADIGCVSPDTKVTTRRVDSCEIVEKPIQEIQTYFENDQGSEEENREAREQGGYDLLLTPSGKWVVPLQLMYLTPEDMSADDLDYSTVSGMINNDALARLIEFVQEVDAKERYYNIVFERGAETIDLVASMGHPFYLHRDAQQTIASSSLMYSASCQKMNIRSAVQLKENDQVKGYFQEVLTVKEKTLINGYQNGIYNVIVASQESAPDVKDLLRNYEPKRKDAKKGATIGNLGEYLVTHKPNFGLNNQDLMIYTNCVASGTLNLQVKFNQEYADKSLPENSIYSRCLPTGALQWVAAREVI